MIDPVAGDTYRAVRGQGAYHNDRPIAVSSSQSLGEVGTGYCNRIPPLIIEEAGGVVQERDQQRMIEFGERVVAACPGVFPRLG